MFPSIKNLVNPDSLSEDTIDQYPQYFLLGSNNTIPSDLPPYWQLPYTDDMILNSKLTLAAGTISLIAALIVIALYIYAYSNQKSRLAGIVNPHNHFIFMIQLSAFFSSITFIITGALRLYGSHRRAYLWCDTSFLVIQIFGEPQVHLELFFLVAILVSIYKPHWLPRKPSSPGETPPFVFYSVCTSYFVSIASSFGCMIGLPILPNTGTRGDAVDVSWCWIPDHAPGESERSPALIATQFLTFYAWVFITPFLGFGAFVVVWRMMDRPTKAVQSFLQLRLVYAISFCAIWLFPMLSRLHNNPHSFFHMLQAVCEPSLPFWNAVIFLCSEVIPRLRGRKVLNGANLHRQPSSAVSKANLLQNNAASVDDDDHSRILNNNNEVSLPSFYSTKSNSRRSLGAPFSRQLLNDHDANNINRSSCSGSATTKPPGSASSQPALSSIADTDQQQDEQQNEAPHRVRRLPAGDSQQQSGVQQSVTFSQATTTRTRGLARNIDSDCSSDDFDEIEENDCQSLSSAFGEGGVQYASIPSLQGVEAVMHTVTLSDNKKSQKMMGIQEAEKDGITITFDEITQSWHIEVDPKAKDITPESVMTKLQAIKFVRFDAYIHGGIMAFLSGFCDLAGAALSGYYTGHITGSIGVVSLFTADYVENSNFVRHIAGIGVYFLGVSVCAELFRLIGNKMVGARALLFWIFFFLLNSFVAARTHENIGSKEWNDSSASWIGLFLMCFALTGMNVYQRVAQTGPIFTMQTGNTTAFASDFMLAIFSLPVDPDARATLFKKLRGNAVNVVSFTVGGITACQCARHRPELCFGIPALVSCITLGMGWGIHAQ